MHGRHRRRTGGSLRTPAAIAAIVALVAVAAVAVRTVAADARGCANDLRVSVAAAPDIEPVVRAIATRWSSTNPKVDGDCVDVQVHAAEPADVANRLSVQAGGTINVAADPLPTPSDADIPAVWIPDSSAWITRMQAVNRDAFEGDSRSLASSPVVFAVPEGLAGSLLPAGTTKLGAAQINAVLTQLAKGGVKLAAVEPRRDTAGLVGATAVKNAVVAGPADLVNMVRAYRAVNVAPTQRALLDEYTENEIAPMSEQALAGYDRAVPSGPSVPLVAVPLDPTVTLDYPYIKVAGKSRATAQAADLFQTVLAADANRDAYLRAGFRAADGSTGAGFPTGHGIGPATVPPQPFADGATINEVLGYWTATKSPSRVLTLVDVTNSMTKPFTLNSGAQTARIDVLRQTAIDGLKLFTDDSELGLWAFASEHQELAPVAVLDAAQRTRLTTALGSRAVAATDVCGLYETVLAAYKTLRDGYRAGRSNTVVVFTDGRNTKPGLSLDDFETQLELATDPTRPVRVVLLGIGPDVDQNELNAIAQRTGGRAFSVQDPQQIGTIFLQALLRPGS